MSTYSYVDSYPLKFADPFGLSPRDVENIINGFNDYLNEMNDRGNRMGDSPLNGMGLGELNPLLNNAASTFGAPYLGCGDQEYLMRLQLQQLEFDDKWTFTQQSSVLHRWGKASSSNPNDPTIYYDPWNGTIATVKKGH
jgi:hypothetical protein